MKIFLIVIIVIHGLIHLMGFAKAYNLAELSQLTKPISHVSGIMWLVSAMLFLAALTMLLLKIDAWWIVGVVAIALSQIVIINSWSDAKWGTIANIIILLPVIVSLMGTLPSSFRNIYKTEVENRLNNTTDIPILLEEDLQHLPAPVSKYLYYVGAVGKPNIINFRSVSSGKMKPKMEGNWTNINSQQFNFYNDPSRFFYIESKMYGIPFDGLHVYKANIATMQIKIASIFKVVDAMGKEMNQSETVTFFNDMCLFAPAGLADKNIQWKTIDTLSVEATYAYQESTIRAQLFFNQKGELTNFISDDRYQSENGKTYNNYRWSTPVKEYKEFDGRIVPTNGEAIWHMPGGEYAYAVFHLEEIEYNRAKYK